MSLVLLELDLDKGNGCCFSFGRLFTVIIDAFDAVPKLLFLLFIP
jgi:hypothetical protein